MEGAVKKSKSCTKIYAYVKLDEYYMGKTFSALGAYFGDKDSRNFFLQTKSNQHDSLLIIPFLKKIFSLINDDFPVQIICNCGYFQSKSKYWDNKYKDIRSIIKERNIKLIYTTAETRNLAKPFVYLNIKNQANGLIPTFEEKQKIKMIARCNAWICCARKMNICKDIRQKICKIVYFDSEDDLF